MAESARVLIVDDEAAARYGITRALESQGYSLEEASNGREALELIRRFAPDVIVSDINMPEMDGLTLLREVKSDARSPLVVLITAYGSEGVAIEALRAGAYDYLAKPFELDELRAVVRNAVGQKQLRRDLDNALAELAQSEKMATLGRLVAGVAHEINTPLGTLQSSADTLRRAALRIAGGEAAGPLSDVVKAAAEQTQIASGRISSIVANLEAFAQLDRAEFQQVNLHEGLERTIAVLAPGWNAQIEMTPEFGELPEIECRPRDLNQLFMNLLLNAQEAIERNGGRGVIRVRTRAGDGEVRVEIEDDGIAAGPLDRIFEPRFTTEGGRIGAGLGMAACNQIARTHGGRIEVESGAEAGSVFRVILPVRRPA